MSRLLKILFGIFLLLMTIKSAPAQNDYGFSEIISEKFRKYLETIPREEIFIHTDRLNYISGEVLWFNIYLIDRQSNKPSLHSSLVYFEILNSENRPVVQKRIGIKNGFGPGQITLPDTLSTGIYSIRAYTNWMKNFLPSNCFLKEIGIYNSLKPGALKQISHNGKLIDSLPEKYPSSGHSSSGLGLRVNNLVPDSLIVFLDADEQVRLNKGNQCYLLIQTHGIINLIKTMILTSSSNRIGLNKDILLPGINQVTIFDSGGKLQAERYIYTPSGEYTDLTMDSPDSVKTRNKISLVIRPEKFIATSSNISNFSISVAAMSVNEPVNVLENYMIFGTEFGILPDSIKNSSLQTLSPAYIDSFLLTVKSSWIDWNSILNGDIPHLKYKAEKDDHYLSGTLFEKNSGIPYRNKCLFLSIPEKIPTFQYAITDSSGHFIFRVPVDEKNRNLIIQPEEADLNGTIRIESSFSEEYTPLLNNKGVSNESLPAYISKMSTNYQVSRIYELSETGELLDTKFPVQEVKRFYGKPDLELLLTDYIKLPTMEEVFFELTPGIIFKKKKSGYTVSIYDPIEKAVYNKPPGLFIDGVVINDPAVLAQLDPALVEKIDAVSDLYLIGDYCFYGIINVITHAGDFSSETLPDYAVRLNYQAAEKVVSFFSPDYSTEELRQKRIPDFRNTLYWNQSLRQDTAGTIRINFWAPDSGGNYEIHLEGISSEGTPVSLRKIIRVE